MSRHRSAWLHPVDADARHLYRVVVRLRGLHNYFQPSVLRLGRSALGGARAINDAERPELDDGLGYQRPVVASTSQHKGQGAQQHWCGQPEGTSRLAADADTQQGAGTVRIEVVVLDPGVKLRSACAVDPEREPRAFSPREQRLVVACVVWPRRHATSSKDAAAESVGRQARPP